MDYTSLWAEIQANPACAPHIVPSEPKVDAAIARAGDEAIAAILSAGRTRITSRMVSERTILGEYPAGPVAADAVLGKLEAFVAAGHPLSSVVGRAMRLVKTVDGIDFGSPATRAMLDALAAGGVLTATEADTLKGMATVPDPITAADVSRAVRGPRN